jgi:hypothetical protein
MVPITDCSKSLGVMIIFDMRIVRTMNILPDIIGGRVVGDSDLIANFLLLADGAESSLQQWQTVVGRYDNAEIGHGFD